MKPSLLLLFAVLSGCSAVDSVGEYIGPQDMSGDDMSPALDLSLRADMRPPVLDMAREDMEPARDMAMACEPSSKTQACMLGCGMRPDGCGGMFDCGSPRTAAEVCATACGLQPDGCGAMLECEPCKCENGNPLEPTCGVCGLGAPSCDASGVLSCEVPEIPGLSDFDCLADIIFVDKSKRGSLETGTREEPFLTLTSGLTSAEQNGARLVLIAGSATYEEDELSLPSGVSLVGGFNEMWQRSEAERPTLLAMQGHTGLLAQDIVSPTLLSHLNVKASNTTTSESTYGIRALRANRLILSNLNIVSLAASNGQDGQSQNRSPSGGAGNAGRKGQRSPEDPFAFYDCPPPTIGSPGSFCSQKSSGEGAGGSGGCTDAAPQDGASIYGSLLPPFKPLAAGGEAGTSASPSGKDGEDAPDITDRVPGGFTGERGGSVINDLWRPNGRGFMGRSGSNGIDGGGGGGAWMRDSPYSSGPSGGQGGAGGCGGKGGLPGDPGNSTFGLFITDSLGMSIGQLMTITTERGGDGGVGGNGGEGGAGGVGGVGPNESCVVREPIAAMPNPYTQCQTLPYRSGNGGDGGKGGDGSPGGGGAGGDSIGIFCHNSTVAIVAEVDITVGSPGAGGRGGKYPDGTPGNDGEAGKAIRIEGCD